MSCKSVIYNYFAAICGFLRQSVEKSCIFVTPNHSNMKKTIQRNLPITTTYSVVKSFYSSIEESGIYGLRSIGTVKEAKKFLKSLYDNGEAYHPEDNAFDLEWEKGEKPTTEECYKLNDLMSSIYALAGNEDHQNMLFDPCEYLSVLDCNVDIDKPVKLKDPAWQCRLRSW